MIQGQPEEKPSAYRAAGVDISAGERAVDLISPLARSTFNPRVVGGIGAFGGIYRLEGYEEPVLVSSMDGVGTKLRVASLMGIHATVGVDLVNHCVNDIWTLGADPLFFLDYFAAGHLVPERVAEVVEGMAEACKAVNCALIGGETAEMPGLYASEDYDLAGTIIGAVERWNLIDGAAIRVGDLLVGLPSSGLHTNGYSLVRRILGLEEHPERLYVHHEELGRTLGEELLETHRCYYRPLKPFQKRLRGLAHITGGGIVGNLPRILNPALRAIVRKESWDVPPIYRMIQRAGVEEEEMYRVFNMGIGMVAIVRSQDAEVVASAIPGGCVIGEVVERGEDKEAIALI